VLDTGENQPMTEREAGTEIMIRLTEQFLELVNIYKEASRNFVHIFLLNKASLKFKNYRRMYKKY
jgi:hypothetical protein